MEKKLKRRVLSLSLSQQGKDVRRIHSRRTCSSAKSFDSASVTQDTEESVVKFIRDDVSDIEPQDVPALACDAKASNCMEHLPVSTAHSGTVKEQSVLNCQQITNNSVGRSSTDTNSEQLGSEKIPTPIHLSSPSALTILTSQRGKSTEDHLRARVEPEVNSVCTDQEDSSSVQGLDQNSVSNCNNSTMCQKSEVENSSKGTKQEAAVMNVNKLLSSASEIKQPTQSIQEIEVMQCPLCFKNFNKKQNKTSHLKACALKQGMTTKQLIDALDLQRRQIAERKALGLPTSASEPSKSKRKENQSGQGKRIDSSLQLAMALSLSMHDHDQKASEKNLQGYSPSLETFGFLSKPVLESIQSNQVPTSYKGKGKTCQRKTPILLTRTAEERQQIITEKVAMVLMEEMDLKQESPNEISIVSPLLQEYHNKGELLWNKSQLSPSKGDRISYYVNELQSFISPSKVRTGSKVLHLSQVAGRVRTPDKEERKPTEKHKLFDTSYEGDQESLPSVRLTENDGSSDSDSSSKCSPESCHGVAKLEIQLRAKLFNDWAGMVNNSSMSDLVIYPQEGREIYTHKLMLLVRCPDMLQSVVRQDDPITGNEVEVILWPRIPHVAALAFLEYVYCGSVKSIPALGGDLSNIKRLAIRYKVRDLLKYLKGISNVQMPLTQSVITAITDPQSPLVDAPSEHIPDASLPENYVHQFEKEKGVIALPTSDSDTIMKRNRLSKDLFASPNKSETDSIYSHPTLSQSGSGRSVSPDIFEDEVDKTCEKSIIEHTGNQSRLSSNQSILAQEDVISDVLSGSPELVSRPPSCPLSTCSDRTVLLKVNSPSASEATGRPASRQLSTCSEDTVVLELNSPPHSEASKQPPSPQLSICSEGTVMLRANSPSSDISDSGLVRIPVADSDNAFEVSPSSTDPKRKLSDHAEEEGNLSSKRLCSWNSNQGNNSIRKDPESEICPNVELYDLTQDSNPRSPPLSGSRRSSKDSSECVVICSDDDNNVPDIRKDSVMVHSGKLSDGMAEPPVNESMRASEHTAKLPIEKKGSIGCDSEPESTSGVQFTEEQELGLSPIQETGEPYISPVWDGFEDLNYDDMFVGAVEDSRRDSPKRSEPFLVSHENSALSFSGEENNPKELILGGCPKNTSPSECQNDNQPTIAKDLTEKASSSFGMLLEDSFNHVLTNSILQTAEMESNNAAIMSTPKSVLRTPASRFLSDEAVTPMANYSAMKTPHLKKEMKKYGLKPSLGKRKGKIMLRHIYNELHPWVPISEGKSCGDETSLPSSQPVRLLNPKPLSLSQPTTSRKHISSTRSNVSDDDMDAKSADSGDESDLNKSSSSSENFHEGSYLEDWGNELETFSQAVSQSVNKTTWVDIHKFITSHPQLHQKVLEYEPIWIDQFQADLRSSGIKIKMADLMTLLDEKCVTYRTVSSGPRVKKKKTTKKVTKKNLDQHGDEAELSV